MNDKRALSLAIKRALAKRVIKDQQVRCTKPTLVFDRDRQDQTLLIDSGAPEALSIARPIVGLD